MTYTLENPLKFFVVYKWSQNCTEMSEGGEKNFIDIKIISMKFLSLYINCVLCKYFIRSRATCLRGINIC